MSATPDGPLTWLTTVDDAQRDTAQVRGDQVPDPAQLCRYLSLEHPHRQPQRRAQLDVFSLFSALRRATLGVKGSQIQILSSRRPDGRFPCYWGAAHRAIYQRKCARLTVFS
jgi:hypothetical protein